jgi:predicted O-linked N-acetylglucosamine transferase (SPINDLY family)
LPVLTCRNGTFAGRVASSLLNAVDLPDLVTDTLGAYEKAAIELFHRRDRLAEFRQHLVHQRDKSRLFDTDALRRRLETAYYEMWRRTEAFEAVTSLAVGQDGSS